MLVINDDDNAARDVRVGPNHVYVEDYVIDSGPPSSTVTNNTRVYTFSGSELPLIRDFKLWYVDDNGNLWGNGYPSGIGQLRSPTGALIETLDGVGFVGFIHDFGGYQWRYRASAGSVASFDVHDSTGVLVKSVPASPGSLYLEDSGGRSGYPAIATFDGGVVSVIERRGIYDWPTLYTPDGTKLAALPFPPGDPTASTQNAIVSGGIVLVHQYLYDGTNGERLHRYSTAGTYLGSRTVEGWSFAPSITGVLPDASTPATTADGVSFWHGGHGNETSLLRVYSNGFDVVPSTSPRTAGVSGSTLYVIENVGPTSFSNQILAFDTGNRLLSVRSIGEYDLGLEGGAFSFDGGFAIISAPTAVGTRFVDVVATTGQHIGRITIPPNEWQHQSAHYNGVLARFGRTGGDAEGTDYDLKVYDLTECPSSGGPPLPPSPNPCPAGGVCDSVGFIDQGGQWRIWDEVAAGTSANSFYYGNPGDYPFMGDWNGDGTATPGLYRQSDGFAYLRDSNTQGIADRTFYFGNPGDVPLVGDFDGDGKDTVSIYRQSEGRVYIMNALGEDGGGLGAADYSFYFGNPGDQPFTGDFDGDGIDTVGLYRTSSGFAYFRDSNSQGVAEFQFYYGNPGDVIMAGDWRGTGVDTVAVYRPSNGYLYINFQNAPGNADATFSAGLYTAATTAGRN